MIDLISSRKSQLSGHTELRVQKNMIRNVSVIQGNVMGNAYQLVEGVSARVYDKGYWGFASAAEYNDTAIKSVIDSAARNASFFSVKLGGNKPALPQLPGGKHSTLVTEYNDIEQKTLIEFCKDIDSYIEKKYPALTGRIVSARSDATEKHLAVSDGADVYSLMPRSRMIIQLSVTAADGAVIELFENLLEGPGFFMELFSDPKKLYDKVDIIYEKVMKKAEGVFANAGVADVILDTALAGILAHEAIGHTTEADLVLGGSVAGPYLNKPVASEIVSLVDFANTYNGSPLPQPIFVDDEGTVAKDAVIIKDGILKGYMHNRETAQRYGHEPTGNARAYLFSDEPLIRMRNTAILPGKDKLEDMIASVDDGYYFINTGNGQADLTSEFMFGVNFGYEIKNGKLGKAVRDTTISGVAFDLLKTVTMLSDEMTWDSDGMCGKKQPIAVGMGGPAVKCRVNIGGR